MESWQELKAAMKSDWDTLIPLFSAENRTLTKTHFQLSSHSFVVALAFNTIRTHAKRCGWLFLKSGKGVLDIIEYATLKSESFIEDKQSRINVDYFMCQIIFSSLPFARTHVITYYKTLKNQYNYDLVQQIRETGEVKEMLERLVNLSVLLKYSLEATRETFSTKDVFDYFEVIVKKSNNQELRAVYVNILLKLSTEIKKDIILRCVYKADEIGDAEYFQTLVKDQSIIEALFDTLQQKRNRVIGNVLNPQNTQHKEERSSDDDFLIPKRLKINDESPQDPSQLTISPFIMVASESEKLEEVRTAILENNFIVLDGPIGCGKSTLLSKIASDMKESVLSLFIDSTTDLKSLVGSYVCTENIGQFEWRNGPLIKCMEEGMWLLLENLSEASEEVLDGLIRCAHEGRYLLTSQGRSVLANYKFKIIGVGNFSIGGKSESKKIFVMNACKGGYLCRGEMSEECLKEILKNRYPNVMRQEELIYSRVSKIWHILRSDKVYTKRYSYFSRGLSADKMLKLFNRINFHLSELYGDRGIQNNMLVTEMRKRIFLEVMETMVFAEKEAIYDEKLVGEILEILELPKEEHILSVLKYYPEIEATPKAVKIGKLGVLPRSFFGKNLEESEAQTFKSTTNIIYNAYSSRLIEKISSCLAFDEPCLLVGDTGCGKTTMAQHVAEQFRKQIFIYNMNQGSDAIDLIGGFKPIDVRLLIKKVLVKYIKRFEQVANIDANKAFIDQLTKLYHSKNYSVLLKGMLSSIEGIKQKVIKKALPELILHKWMKLEQKLKNLYANKDKIESNLAFHFVEGNLIKAIRQGDWVLIDEINLASNEVLQKLLPIIEGKSLVLYERGDLKEIKRHPMFRIIGCMNPGNEIGKKELPENVRAKFTEIYVHDISEREDILNLVKKKLGSLVDFDICQKIVDLFMQIKTDSESNQLEDGYNRKTHISLRNLARALNYIRQNIGLYGAERTVYDGLYLGFGTSLNKTSQLHFEKQLEKLLDVSTQKYFDILLKSSVKERPETQNLFGFLVNIGTLAPKKAEECEFLVTDTFKKYIVDLLRAISNSDLPVLLEGPTSAGKTSMVQYIAERTGFKCVRVNNHHHTEIEEYIGTYLPDSKGRLVFHEGVLIEAMKMGHWLILDELNLARSEILESLNRLLDDNKELFVNETQSYVRPHPNFRIFATQNPTSYGGRKELSKAFKNRFVQIYFDDISEKDLELILQKRCIIAPSYCKKLMSILKDLKVFRQRNNFFLGKEGVITVRDLIKWGNREVSCLEDLAMEGYCLLAERLRTSEEREFIQKVIEKHCKVKLHVDKYYENYSKEKLEPLMDQELPFYLQLNQGFKRMACLVLKALVNNEPVLLIGETGCGKTTLAQLVSYLRNSQFFSINCHQYTESSDFLGSLRPVRNKEQNIANLEEFLKTIDLSPEQIAAMFDATVSIDLRVKILEQVPSIAPENVQELSTQLEKHIVANEKLFEWQDGPLVESMKKGAVFLIDEISLAEDSVLERLNSVLEADRFLLLPEKAKSEQVKATEGFIIIATMNPGGDFGKRELSPALRNRFTEIWVEPLTNKNFLIQAEGKHDVIEMIGKFLALKKVYESEKTRYEISEKLYEFLKFYNVTFCEKYSLDKKNLTMRDIVALMEFICRCGNVCSVRDLYLHALSMVVIDPIGFMQIAAPEKHRMTIEIEAFIQNQLEIMAIDENEDEVNIQRLRKESLMEIESHTDLSWKVGIFSLQINVLNPAEKMNIQYSLSSKKTQNILEKIVRGLQLDKSILLEGMPGVGKSSIIEYIAAKTCNKLTKISLSEQTDIVDLLGSDLPAASSKDEASQGKTSMKFKWYDGVLLDALKNGSWILLEELNLASQSILEGLNAILDHRGTVFIPEMNMSFTKHPQFRLFATQNPLSLGGGRKGLPASFMNRFTKIYVEDFSNEEYEVILKDLYGEDADQADIIQGLLRFSKIIESQYYKRINLRDLLRFYEVYLHSDKNLELAFEIAFGRSDAEKYFTLNMSNGTEQRTKQRASWEVELNVKIPISYSYMDQRNQRVGLLNSQRKALNFIQMMVERCSKYCSSFVLTGKSGSGKTSLVRLLSQLNSGKRVVEFSLNSQTDSSELIGGYDQVDINRRFSALNEKVASLIRFCVTTSSRIGLTDINVIASLRCLEVLAKNGHQAHEQEILIGIKEALDLMASFENVVDIQEEIVLASQRFEELRISIANNSVGEKGKQSSGHFEWFYSQIIEAVKRGDWLVLDNVGRANQAVLARLNPLLEWNLNGKREIVITECHTEGIQQGPEVITIHPDFRVFFLFDGESDTLNEAIRNKCVEIRVDFFEEGKYFSDLQNLFELHIDQQLVPSHIKEYVLELAMKFATTVSQQRKAMAYSDFGTFSHFLQLIERNMSMNLLDLNLNMIVVDAFKQAYGPKGIKFSISIYDIISSVPQQNGQNVRSDQLFSKVPPAIRESIENHEQLLGSVSWSSSLNFSEFPLNPELHRYKALGKALFAQFDIKEGTQENAITHTGDAGSARAKIQENFSRIVLQQCFAEHIIQYITNVDSSILREISLKKYSSDALYQRLVEEFEAIRIRRKVFAATSEFKKTKEFVLSSFQKALTALKNVDAPSAVTHARSVIQCALLQAIRNIQQLPKIYNLVSQKLSGVITSLRQSVSSAMETEETEETIEQNLFVSLWRACEYFESMPRTKTQFEQREKVHYLLSSNNISVLDFHEELQEMIHLRKHFRNMYYLENSKTRLTSMEILALIYNLRKSTKSGSEDASEEQEAEEERQRTTAIFQAFKSEVFKILSSDEDGEDGEVKRQAIKKNEFEIVIEEEYSNTVLKSIPILSCEKGIKFWELKMQEQQENFESSFFENSAFREMREFFVFKGIEKFALSDDASNTTEVRETVKLNIVHHIDRPDYYVMRVFQLFKNELTIHELVEIFYLAQMKNRNVDTFHLRRCTKLLQNIKLKHLPLLNREVNLLRSAIDFSLSIEHHSKEVNDLFLLAYVWLLDIFQKINRDGDKSNKSQTKKAGQILEGKQLYNQVSMHLQKNEIESIIVLQEEILLKDEHGNHFLQQLCTRVNEELSILLRQNELLKLGVVVIRLFSINKGYFEVDGHIQRDCLSELLKEDYEYQYEEASYLDQLNDYASLCVIEKALTNTIDFSDTAHQEHIQTLHSQQAALKSIKKRMIFRGYSGDNITSFSEFFEESIPFIQKIESFLPRLADLHLGTASSLDFEELRHFLEVKKHIDNWLHISFEKYYAPFSDFLIPLHFGLLLVKQYISQVLGKSKMSESDIHLICQSEGERIDQFRKVLWEKKNVYKLKNCDHILKNLRISGGAIGETPEMREFCSEVMSAASENLMLKEEIDKLAEDDTTKLIKATRQLERMIVDEYKKETVEEYKEKERLEIQEAFNTFSKDYVHLLQVDLSIAEKLELQQGLNKDEQDDDVEDEDKDDVKMEELTKKQLDGIKHRSQTSILEILTIYENNRNARGELYSNVASIESASNLTGLPKSMGKWKDFTFAHKIEYLKLGLVQNLLPHDPIADILEYSVAFGQIQKTNLFEDIMPLPGKKAQQLDTSQSQFNVYKDIIPSENVKIFKPLMTLLSSIRRLLHEEEIFENNAILQNLAILCDFTLEQSVLATPLNKIITGLQFISEKVEEWNISTPKVYSLITEITPIIEILLYWRKLERRCWKFMLSDKDKEIETIDVVMFLKLRNLVVTSNGSDSANREQLFKILDQYVRTSVMGNFGLRMKGVYYLSYCDMEVERLGLQDLLQQIYKYYMQFFSQYASALAENRAEHEKDCQEYVVLAGWESKNYLTLKATVDKFQGKVHRIVKRYRDFLNEPVGRHIFESSRNQILAENYEAFRTKYEKVFVSENEAEQKECHIMKFSLHDSAHTDKIITIGRKLLLSNCLSVPGIKGYSKCETIEKPQQLCTWLYKEQMITHIFERVKDLHLADVTRNMKFKAVLDIFKYLKTLGFTSYFLNTSQLMGDNTLIYDMRSIKLDSSLLGSELADYIKDDIHYIEKCYYSTLDKICVLRYNTNYHEDLTKDNIRRGSGFLIEYFYYIKRAYIALNGLFAQAMPFIAFAENIAKHAESQNNDGSCSAPTLLMFNDFQELKQEVTSFIARTLFLCTEVNQVTFFIPTSNQLEINSLRTLCEALAISVPLVLNGKLVDAKAFEGLLTQLVKIAEKLRANTVKASKLEHKDIQILIQNKFEAATRMLSRLQQSLENSLTLHINETKDLSSNTTSDENSIIKDLQLFAQKMIKTVQSYKENLKYILEDQEEEEQVEGEEIRDDASTASLGNNDADSEDQKKEIVQPMEISFIQNEERILKRLTKTVEDFAYKLKAVHEQSILLDISKKSNGTIAQMLVIIQLYLKNTILYHTKSLKAQSKFMNLLGIILYNLVYKGFCQPKKQGEEEAGSDDEDGKYEMRDGTGIGEGQGQENVSKDIEFEEQLLGNKNEEEVNPEEEENDPDNKDDKKEDDFEMDQDFKGTTSKPEDLNENEEEQAEKEGDEQFSDVDEDELDFKMWQGDDNQEENEDQDEEEDKKQNRKKEDIEFKTKNKPQGEENDRAKEEEKEKDEQRNIEDFEKTERQEKEDEINEEKNPVQEEEEDSKDKKDDETGKPSNQPEEEEKQDEDGEGEDSEYDGKEGEQLDPELMKGDMELEEEEEELNDDHQDGGSQEGELEDGMEDDDEGGQGDIDPIDQVSDFEEEDEKNDLSDENKNTALENDDVDVDEQDQQEEEREYPKEIKKNQKQPPKKQEKKYGVEGNDDQIEKNDENEDESKEKEEKQKGQNELEEEDNRKNHNDGQEEQQSQQANNENKFSLDFLQQIIEKTQPNAKDLQNFFKDLNVVQEAKEKPQEESSVPPPLKEDLMNEDQEYEAFNPNNNIDPEELKNLLATNLSAQEMKNASNIPQDQENEDAMDMEMPQPEKPQGEQQQPKDDTTFKQQTQQKPEKKREDNHKKDNRQEEQIDFLEEQKNAEERDRAAKEKKKDKENENGDEDVEMESEIIDKNAHLNNNKKTKNEEDDEIQEEEDLLAFLENENETVEERREKMLKLMQECKSNPDKFHKGQELWQKIESEARFHSVQLCEELKAVLEPTLIASFKGDYKSGKRLNMKKIIPYIASNFRKDKIWLRRNEPSKRSYQILLAIDDSLSMSQQNVGYFALQSMTVLSLAMAKMEVGQIGIASIKNGLHLLHDFNTPLTPADSPFILAHFDFSHSDNNSSDLDLVRFMRSTIDTFKDSKGGSKETHQICFIMSDGRFNKKLVRPLVQEAEENNQLFVFIVLDKSEDKESIMNIKSTSHKYVNGKLQIEMKRYLEDFPYKNYIIVKDVHELTKVLVDILRQYYEMKNNS